MTDAGDAGASVKGCHVSYIGDERICVLFARVYFMRAFKIPKSTRHSRPVIARMSHTTKVSTAKPTTSGTNTAAILRAVESARKT